MTCPDPRPLGFTLIEMLVALAIAAIVAAIAYPSYTEHVRRARQTESIEVMGTSQVGIEKAALAQGRFPANFAPGSYTELFDYSYSPASDGSDYVLTATGKSSGPAAGIWSGATSRGARCTCRNCSAPASFTRTTSTCPSGTQAF